MLDDITHYCEMFTSETISQAPTATGLYAWYASLNAGPRDWELEINDGADIGIERLKNLLRRQTDRLGFRSLEAVATGAFSQTWTGQLNDQTSDLLKDILAAESGGAQKNENYDKKRAPKLQSSLESRDSRLLLVKALELAIPCLSAPIYVGVAEDLKSRLSSHANQLNTLSAAVARNPDIRDRLRSESKSNFAIRVIASGFLPANLRVLTLNLELLATDLKIENSDPRTVAEAAEWILNRWNRPYLGRR